MIDRVIDKFVAIGAVRAEVMYYGIPAWWKPEMRYSKYGVLHACEFLAPRYQVLYHSLVDDNCKAAVPYNPKKSLDMALFDYLRTRLIVSGLKPGHIYFPPTRSIIGFTKKEILAHNVPLGSGTEYNLFFTPYIKWDLLSASDRQFVIRVLNLGGENHGK